MGKRTYQFRTTRSRTRKAWAWDGRLPLVFPIHSLFSSFVFPNSTTLVRPLLPITLIFALRRSRGQSSLGRRSIQPLAEGRTSHLLRSRLPFSCGDFITCPWFDGSLTPMRRRDVATLAVCDGAVRTSVNRLAPNPHSKRTTAASAGPRKGYATGAEEYIHTVTQQCPTHALT
jgi:hypothetical protein